MGQDDIRGIIYVWAVQECHQGVMTYWPDEVLEGSVVTHEGWHFTQDGVDTLQQQRQHLATLAAVDDKKISVTNTSLVSWQTLAYNQDKH